MIKFILGALFAFGSMVLLLLYFLSSEGQE